MDDLSEKISALLSDPDGMERIKNMAQNLLGESKTSEPEPNTESGDIDITQLTRMLSVIKSNKGDDARVRLLLALKPNLSKERQNKVDSAIRILKLIELAPLIQDMGIFNL